MYKSPILFQTDSFLLYNWSSNSLALCWIRVPCRNNSYTNEVTQFNASYIKISKVKCYAFNIKVYFNKLGDFWVKFGNFLCWGKCQNTSKTWKSELYHIKITHHLVWLSNLIMKTWWALVTKILFYLNPHCLLQFTCFTWLHITSS